MTKNDDLWDISNRPSTKAKLEILEKVFDVWLTIWNKQNWVQNEWYKVFLVEKKKKNFNHWNDESATARARTRRPRVSAPRHLLVLVCLASLGAVLLASAYGQRGRVAETTAPKPASKNPFGVMLPSKLARTAKGMLLAKDLGAVYIRPESIFLSRWDGTCPPCDAARGAGLRLVLTVRNDGPEATAPPSDLTSYQRTLGQVLDKYRPAVLAVENEENSALFYTGTPEEYLAELKAACQVAHQKGIPCTNGGLVSSLVALMVYDYYLETGQAAAARDFASRAFEQKQQRLLATAKVREQIRKGKALLQAYRSAGLDYVNFHWYIADTRALEEAVAYLNAQTSLPVITNEVGQFTDDPRQTTAVMAKIVDLGLPIAVWFGLDGPKARGLVDPDGGLRPTGEAFRRFNQKAFSGRN